MALDARGSGARRRPRDATATRDAILAAARGCFAATGYEGTTVRGIASVAGVDVALVSRYFGSKDGLFAAALAPPPGTPAVPRCPRAELGERLVRLLLEPGDAGDAAVTLLVAARPPANERAIALVRRAVDEVFVGPLAERLGGTDRRLRAELVVAHLLGLAQCRSVLSLDPFSAREAAVLAGFVGPILQRYIDDDCGGDLSGVSCASPPTKPQVSGHR